MHRRLQKVLKNSRAGGTDLSEQKVTERFQEFQSRGSDLSAPKVTETFQEVQSRRK